MSPSKVGNDVEGYFDGADVGRPVGLVVLGFDVGCVVGCLLG